MGNAGVAGSIELQNFVAAKLKVQYFLRFASGRLIIIKKKTALIVLVRDVFAVPRERRVLDPRSC